jgi:CRP/FNR family transcriptional regulator, transcriptional activator FtrB
MTENNIEADIVRSISLFRNVSDASLQELVVSASFREAAARTLLFKEGDRPANLYTLVRGTVELYSEHDNRRFTNAVVHAGRTFILPSVLTNHNALSARVLKPSELIVVPVKLVSALLGRDPKFAFAVIEELTSEYQVVIEDFKSHRMRSTTERVAHWMLRCDGKNGLTGQFTIPFDKRVLASYLGMAPEHLSRSFSALASAGVVVAGRSVTLKDRAALSAAAGLSLPEPI